MLLTALPSPAPLLAMDRSVRTIDKNGRLHVAVSNISKANVCPYLGREIPGWQEARLDPDAVFHLLRDPGELAKGVDTFNNLPILSEHVPVTAFTDDSHGEELVVGSTGTDAAIDGPYVTNSLVIWAKPSIDGIVNDEKRELSIGYWYRVDWTPGNFEGVDYDGVMRDIVGNHVALVFDGRAGPDVIVGDEKPMALKSKRALMVSGGLAALIRPLMAQDAKLDLSSTLSGVTNKSLSKKGASAALAGKVFGLIQPHLAQDADVDVNAICKVIDAVKDTPMGEDEEDEIPDAERPSPVAQDGDDETDDEDMAEDESDGVDADDKKKPAMDAAFVDKRVRAAEQRVMAEQKAIRIAEREVMPVVGELVAMDSAADVYKAGLAALGVDTARLPVAAYGETFRAVKSARDAIQPLAMDTAGAASARTDFDKRFPADKRMKLVKG